MSGLHSRFAFAILVLLTASPTVAPASAAALDQVAPDDPELTRPLTPLEAFKLTPLPEAGRAPSAAPRVRYGLELKGVDDPSIRSRYSQLATLSLKGGDAENLVQLRARANDDGGLLERLLRADGFYDAHADVAVTPNPSGDSAKVEINVTRGELYRLRDIQVTGPATEPPGLARSALDLKAGEPISVATIESAEAKVTLRLPEEGYPFVSLGQRDIVLDTEAPKGDYTLPVIPGPRSRFGGIVTDPHPVFGARHLATISRAPPGGLYDSRKVDDLRRALVATGLYASVGVEPKKTGAHAPDGAELVDLHVQGTPAPTHSISASAGYETGRGFQLAGEWTDRNRFPPEGAVTLQAIAGSQSQLLGATFRRSNAGRRDRTFLVSAQVSRDDIDAYQANTAAISARLSRDSTPLWQKRWTYSAGADLLVTSEDGYDFALGARRRRTYEIAALPVQVGYDRSNSLLDPTRGYRIVLQGSPEASIQGGTTPYLKLLAEVSGYLPATDRFVLASRLRLGSIVGADAADLAPSRRIYAGGGGSVRGFGYQQLGPKAPDAKPIGGASLTEFSLEGRYRRGDFGLVAFVDGGQVYQRTAPDFSNLRFGVGVGARYYTSVGPIRLDVATPLARRAGESRVAVYISIGQAF